MNEKAFDIFQKLKQRVSPLILHEEVMQTFSQSEIQKIRHKILTLINEEYRGRLTRNKISVQK